MDTTELDFLVLFRSGFEHLEFGGTIVESDSYEFKEYRLINEGKEILASGERCKIISEDSDRVIIENLITGEQYTFSKLEFEVAED